MDEELEEFEEILTWIGEDVKNIPLNDQLKIFSVLCEMIEKVKPIYLKYNSFENGSTFFFKM